MATAKVSALELLAPRAMVLGAGVEELEKTRHWHLSQDEEKVVWLVLDRAGESANTLSEEVMRELDRFVARIEALRPKAVVLRSAKPGGFVAGADIRDFKDVDDAQELRERLQAAHGILDRFAALPMPTIAVIHGHCLGGGLELALACSHRLAIEGASFGFPEVLLGLHPGLGGTFRLPALIDPLEAMTMMLTGRTVHTKKARKLGLVDAVIEERHVKNAVLAFANGDGGKAKSGGGWKSGLLGFSATRRLAAKKMRAEVAKRAREDHYPAPYRLIDLWEEHGDNAKAMQKAEIASFAKLLTGETAQNLIRVFFLREGLKGQGRGESGIEHVHVVGAGTMGADIAAWCAARGLRVTLSDLDRSALASAIGRASTFFNKKLHSGIARRDALDRLTPDFAGTGVRQADLVIEAIAENADAKRKLFKVLIPQMKPDAILATNTSSIPLETLRKGLSVEDRLIGIHFFNPVTKMELVEVVVHDKVAALTQSRAQAFCGAINRLPVPVKSAPGFLVNRALTPYLVEALIMHDEGMAKETIDRAAEAFGMPMGPIELADRVGLDICLEVARMLREKLDPSMPPPPDWLEKMVARGETGRKAGKGLYGYDEKGRPRRAKESAQPTSEMTDRLILPLVNSCVSCLREGVVADAETLDGAMIFGTGFAPFRGGPLHYARNRGVDEVVARLEALQERHGERFAPDAGWATLK